MPRRPAPESLSPRALARLRAGPRAFVPTSYDLDPGRRDHADAREPDRRENGLGVAADRAEVRDRAWVDDGAEAGRQEPGGRHSRARHPRAWARVPVAF